MTNPNENSEYHISSTGLSMSASDWLDVHFLAMQPEYEEMLRWVGIQPNWHVLDAASGSGSFLPLITELVGSGGRVSAIDMDPKNVRVIEDRAKQSQWLAPVSARVGSILELPYEDRAFDAVWCANTTEYLSDDELHKMLSELFVKANGVRYPLVGGTRQRYFAGTNSKPHKLPENAQTPTTMAPMLFGDRVHPCMTSRHVSRRNWSQS